MSKEFVIDKAQVLAAQQRLLGQLSYTPCTHSQTLSALTGAEVYLKFENLQFTASFKERGALNCLLAMSPASKAGGVIAMSAGNHAQALAYHGQRLGVPVCIVMPRHTPNTKVEQTRVFGAEVILHGEEFSETLAFTEDLARKRQLSLIHPFDDPLVMAGQGTVALELLEQVPAAEIYVVPVGGGGLISGMSMVAQAAGVEVVGVQMQRFTGAYSAFHRQPAAPQGAGTVAEGIAVKEPGGNTLPIIQKMVHDIVLVSEEQVEQAVFTLLEIEKTVVEGAGAAGLAALFADPEQFRGRKTVVVLSGGNIDMMTLSSVVQRGLVRSKRLVRVSVELPDVPGALAKLTAQLAELESNIIDIEHQRAFAGSSVRTTVVELVLQLRGEEQETQVLDSLRDFGYAARAVLEL